MSASNSAILVYCGILDIDWKFHHLHISSCSTRLEISCHFHGVYFGKGLECWLVYVELEIAPMLAQCKAAPCGFPLYATYRVHPVCTVLAKLHLQGEPRHPKITVIKVVANGWINYWLHNDSFCKLCKIYIFWAWWFNVASFKAWPLMDSASQNKPAPHLKCTLYM